MGDKLFNGVLLFIGGVIIFVIVDVLRNLGSSNEIGRFQASGSPGLILDTKTGQIYDIEDVGYSYMTHQGDTVFLDSLPRD